MRRSLMSKLFGEIEITIWLNSRAVVGMRPRALRAAAEVLADSVDRYVFISSQNVYADVSVPGVDETFPLRTLTTEQVAEANAIDTSGEPSYGAMYGGLKAL